MTATRRVRLGLLALVVVLVAVGSVVWLRRGSDAPAAAAPPPATTPVPTPTVTTPVPTSTPPPPPPVVPHDAVAKAGPTRFRISGPAFTISAHVCAMANERPLDPPGEQHHTVCWVRNEFGVAPGSDSATTYVLGHSWGQDTQEVLNQLSAPATKQILHTRVALRDGIPTYPVTVLNGYVMTLWTPKGILRYRVHDAYGVDKLKLGDIRSTMDDTVRNRIVLITCAERNHTDYDYNVVVDAYLISSQAL